MGGGGAEPPPSPPPAPSERRDPSHTAAERQGPLIPRSRRWSGPRSTKGQKEVAGSVRLGAMARVFSGGASSGGHALRGRRGLSPATSSGVPRNAGAQAAPRSIPGSSVAGSAPSLSATLRWSSSGPSHSSGAVCAAAMLPEVRGALQPQGAECCRGRGVRGCTACWAALMQEGGHCY